MEFIPKLVEKTGAEPANIVAYLLTDATLAHVKRTIVSCHEYTVNPNMGINTPKCFNIFILL